MRGNVKNTNSNPIKINDLNKDNIFFGYQFLVINNSFANKLKKPFFNF